mmetsp:Transcript_13019/g.34647  ORF Transcript_13019/g.34647 Transcript_13019/m.34647 type:complete len:221 (-) Transcript_13019:174-836(-)
MGRPPSIEGAFCPLFLSTTAQWRTYTTPSSGSSSETLFPAAAPLSGPRKHSTTRSTPARLTLSTMRPRKRSTNTFFASLPRALLSKPAPEKTIIGLEFGATFGMGTLASFSANPFASYRCTAISSTSYKFPSYTRPTVMLFGRFLLCVASVKSPHSHCLASFSSNTSPPASSGLTPSFLLASLTTSSFPLTVAIPSIASLRSWLDFPPKSMSARLTFSTS